MIDGGVGEFRCLRFLDYYHNVLVLSAIEFKKNSRIFTFCFDDQTREIVEREDLRGESGVGKAISFEKYGNNRFRGSDVDAMVFEISYSLSED